MIKSSLIISICFLFVLTSFFSCKKDKDAIPYLQLPKNTYDWGYYKKGSLWIYKNDSTGIFDSLIVESSYSEIKAFHEANIHLAHDNAYYYDYFKLYYEPNKFKIHEDLASLNDPQLYRIYDDSFSVTLINSYNNINGYKILLADLQGKIFGSKELNIYDTYRVGNSNFQNVYCYKIIDNTKPCTTYYYMAMHVGTVKIVISDTSGFSSYSLVDWNAIQ